MDSMWWEFFECQRCGKCCEEIGLPYDPESAIQIADYLNISTDQLIEQYYGTWTLDGKSGKGWISDDHKRTPCPFLKSEGNIYSCAIYQVRPLGCRLYPLETDAGRGDVDCPAAKEIDKVRKSLARKGKGLSTCTFDLHYRDPLDEDILSNPYARICLQHRASDKQGGIYLSSKCMTAGEIGGKVEELKKELDKIRKKAEYKFTQSKKKRVEMRNRKQE